MVVVNVDGKDYELTEKHESVMKYIEEAKAIEQGGVDIHPFRSKSLTSISKLSSLSSTSL
jgi:hypothetical protein